MTFHHLAEAQSVSDGPDVPVPKLAASAWQALRTLIKRPLAFPSCLL